MCSFSNFEPAPCCMFSSVTSWPEYRFLRRQVRWSGISISLRISHSLLWSTQSLQWSKSKWFSGIPLLSLWSTECWQFDRWFLCLSKASLYIWKFLVHILLKPSLNNFEHNLTSMRNELYCLVVFWTFFGIALLWDWNENWHFLVLCHCWVFQICWHIDCSTLAVLSFRIWNNPARIPSHPLALSVVILPKSHLTSDSRKSNSRWVTTPSWLSELLFSFSHSVVPDYLQLHGLQGTRLPCPSSSPGVYSNSSPLIQRCYLTNSFSVAPFSSCPQSFPESVSFSKSWLLASGGQSIGVSTSASVIPMNIQDWFPLGWTGLISLKSKELSRVFSSTTIRKHRFFGIHPSLFSLILRPPLSSIHHYYKNHSFDDMDLCWQSDVSAFK